MAKPKVQQFQKMAQQRRKVPKPPAYKPPRPTAYPGYTPMVNSQTGFTVGARRMKQPIIREA